MYARREGKGSIILLSPDIPHKRTGNDFVTFLMMCKNHGKYLSFFIFSLYLYFVLKLILYFFRSTLFLVLVCTCTNMLVQHSTVDLHPRSILHSKFCNSRFVRLSNMLLQQVGATCWSKLFDQHSMLDFQHSTMECWTNQQEKQPFLLCIRKKGL